MKIISINTKSKNYNIYIGNNLISQFSNIVKKEKINKNSHSFWLSWKIKTILDRISNNNKRPLALKLNNKDLANLYRKRSKFYKLSDYKINCEKKNKNEIIKDIFKILQNENYFN